MKFFIIHLPGTPDRYFEGETVDAVTWTQDPLAAYRLQDFNEARLMARALGYLCRVIEYEVPAPDHEVEAEKLRSACKAALAALSQNTVFPADLAAAKGWLRHALEG